MSRRSQPGADAVLPEAFIARQNALLGAEAAAFLAALGQRPERALRINELKASLAEMITRLGLTADPVPWCPTATYLPSAARLGETAEHRAGLFYLQEPSSTALVEALAIERQHRVLDIAAAPGGKATQAASRLGPDGFLLANDVTPARIGPLLANLDAWGYPNTTVASMSAPRLADALSAVFDRVIVDAPCSGEALFRRDPASRGQWGEAQVRGAARRQAKLLASAARTAAPGALLGYSTCTFEPAENELQVARFLHVHSGWDLVDIGSMPGAVTTRIDARPAGDGPAGSGLAGEGPAGAGLARALRFYPHRCRCEGQFIAVLRAPGEPAEPRLATTARRPGASRRKAAPPHPAWTAFADRTLRDQPDPARIRRRGETFYLAPPGTEPAAARSSAPEQPALELAMSAALRPGLPLGRLAGSTFRPAHALAMTLRPDDVQAAEALAGADLNQFRSGLPVRRPGPPDWVLVTLDRWPLGWAQRKDDVIVPRLPGHARIRS
jgi:16S rRNA C967 or C1407 C5-methylase (RsmB/RsmF family)/NOL1/NOP2/fmu family ribosome biogenesis protein